MTGIRFGMNKSSSLTKSSHLKATNKNTLNNLNEIEEIQEEEEKDESNTGSSSFRKDHQRAMMGNS